MNSLAHHLAKSNQKNGNVAEIKKFFSQIGKNVDFSPYFILYFVFMI